MTVDVASKQFSDTVETFLKIFRTDYRFLVEAVHSLLTKNAVFWGGFVYDRWTFCVQQCTPNIDGKCPEDVKFMLPNLFRESALAPFLLQACELVPNVNRLTSFHLLNFQIESLVNF